MQSDEVEQQQSAQESAQKQFSKSVKEIQAEIDLLKQQKLLQGIVEKQEASKKRV